MSFLLSRKNPWPSPFSPSPWCHQPDWKVIHVVLASRPTHHRGTREVRYYHLGNLETRHSTEKISSKPPNLTQHFLGNFIRSFLNLNDPEILEVDFLTITIIGGDQPSCRDAIGPEFITTLDFLVVGNFVDDNTLGVLP